MLVKWLKRIGLLIGGLLGLVLLAILIVLGIGRARIYQRYDIEPAPLNIPSDEATQERGEHLVQAVAHCGYCHGADFSGQVMVNSVAQGVVAAPNLTSGMGGLGARLDEAGWIRAIHHGVTSDGRSTIIMPSLLFDAIGEDDLAAIIAYMRSVPPVDNELPELMPGPMMYLLAGLGPFTGGMSALHIDHEAPYAATPAESTTAEYGAYLVEIAQCRACHGTELAGGRVTPSSPFGPNLTPAGELGGWTQEQFSAAIRTGQHPSGRQLDPYMPWQFFSSMNDTDVAAIWAFLQEQPAVVTRAP